MSSTMPGILETCSLVLMSRLAEKTECLCRVREIGRSSDMGRSATLSNVSSRCSLEDGVATSCNAALKDWSGIGKVLIACTALDAPKIWHPSQCIGSGLLTVVTSPSHSHGKVVIVHLSET